MNQIVVDTDAPLYLDPLASSGPFELLEVDIAPGTPDGAYIRSFVSIQSGPDGSAGTVYDDLAESFDVSASATFSSEAPEPATVGMTCAGRLAAWFVARRRQVVK